MKNVIPELILRLEASSRPVSSPELPTIPAVEHMVKTTNTKPFAKRGCLINS